jgi:hypothetical protein
MAHGARHAYQTMETTTPFDLKQAIADWRQQLNQSPAFSAENLDELEAHLRDSVAQLQGKGLAADEAWIIATKRIGTSTKLEAEYRQTNQAKVWGWRALWMLLGIQVWGLVSGFLNEAGRVTMTAGLHRFNDSKALGVVLPTVVFGAVNLLAFGASVGICWWLIARKGDSIRAKIVPRLQGRGGFITLGLLFCLFALSAKLSSLFLATFAYRLFPPGTIGEGMMYWQGGYPFMVVALLKGAAFIVVTLLLLRRQLRVA